MTVQPALKGKKKPLEDVEKPPIEKPSEQRIIELKPRKTASIHEVTWKHIVDRISTGLEFVLEKGRGSTMVKVADIVNVQYLEGVVAKKTPDISIPKQLGNIKVTPKAVEETGKLIASLNEVAATKKKLSWG
jgi:hypothetical protein